MNVIALPVSLTPAASAVIRTVLRHGLKSALRSRSVIVFAVAMLVITEAVLRLAGTAPRAVVSMLQVVLMIVPLVSIMFGVISWHAAREFNELLLAQPVQRRTLFTGLYFGLIVPLVIAFIAGLAIPFLLHRQLDASVLPIFTALLAAGSALVFVFCGIAILVAVLVDDRLKAVGAALTIWVILTVAYDGVVLLVATTFSDYSLERAMLALTLCNPVDLARTLIVLRSDNAALMGYTGAIMARFLGSSAGTVAALMGIAIWIVVPALAARRAFEKRDY